MVWGTYFPGRCGGRGDRSCAGTGWRRCSRAWRSAGARRPFAGGALLGVRGAFARVSRVRAGGGRAGGGGGPGPPAEFDRRDRSPVGWRGGRDRAADSARRPPCAAARAGRSSRATWRSTRRCRRPTGWGWPSSSRSSRRPRTGRWSERHADVALRNGQSSQAHRCATAAFWRAARAAGRRRDRARRARPAGVGGCVLGLLLVPLVRPLACYYYAFVAALPLASERRADVAGIAVALALASGMVGAAVRLRRRRAIRGAVAAGRARVRVHRELIRGGANRPPLTAEVSCAPPRPAEGPRRRMPPDNRRCRPRPPAVPAPRAASPPSSFGHRRHAARPDPRRRRRRQVRHCYATDPDRVPPSPHRCPQISEAADASGDLLTALPDRPHRARKPAVARPGCPSLPPRPPAAIPRCRPGRRPAPSHSPTVSRDHRPSFRRGRQTGPVPSLPVVPPMRTAAVATAPSCPPTRRDRRTDPRRRCRCSRSTGRDRRPHARHRPPPPPVTGPVLPPREALHDRKATVPPRRSMQSHRRIICLPSGRALRAATSIRHPCRGSRARTRHNTAVHREN